MTTTPPTVPGTTRQEQIQYYSGLLSIIPGVYEGNKTAYRGMNTVQFYDALLAKYPKENPQALAKAVNMIWAVGKVAGNIAAAAGEIAPFTQAATESVPQGFAKFTSPLQFFSSGQFWVRAGEVILGVVLMGVGLSKLAESSSAAKAVVNNVPGLKLASKVVK